MFVGSAVCRECCITEYMQGVLYSGHSVKQNRFTPRCGEDIYRLLSSNTTDVIFLIIPFW
jgi:hypothetical protein